MPKLLRLAPVFLGTASCLTLLALGRAPGEPAAPVREIVEELPPPEPDAVRAPVAPPAPTRPQSPYPHPPAAPQPLPPPRQAADVPGADELLRLRRMVGSPFEGTVLDADPSENAVEQQAFAEALRRAAELTAVTPAPRPEPIPSGPADAWAPSAAPARQTQAGSERAALRELASKVDRLADEVEHLDRYYEQADQLRAVADLLRLEARASDPSPVID